MDYGVVGGFVGYKFNDNLVIELGCRGYKVDDSIELEIFDLTYEYDED